LAFDALPKQVDSGAEAQASLIAKAAIVAEPTMLRPAIASKGLVRWKIETRGKSAHSSKPHLGVNAITQMAHLIAAIEQDSLGLADGVHPLLGPATCNVGVIRGGVQINFVPDRCEIEVDRRILPDENIESVLAHYQQLIDSVARDHGDMDAVMQSPMLTDVPLETDADCHAVQTMTRVLDQQGLDSAVIGVPFGSDASKFGALGIPSMILGPGCIDQAHAAVEYIECEQVIQASKIYRSFMIEFE
jgi:acetylornithine deacetylase